MSVWMLRVREQFQAAPRAQDCMRPMTWAAILLTAVGGLGCTPTPAHPSSRPSAVTSYQACRLPIEKVGPISSVPGLPVDINGFLDVCTGRFAPDSAASFELTTELSPRKMTREQPVLYGTSAGKAGTSGATYVRQAFRWVPVTLDQVSPDGTRYAYEAPVFHPGTTTPSYDAIDHFEIRVVDIASGTERAAYKFFSFTDPGVIVHFAREGIYLSKGCPEGCLADSGQLWLLNPDSGKMTKLPEVIVGANQFLWGWRFSDGAAWVIGSSDDRSGQVVEQRLVRLDLSSGTQTTWATWDGQSQLLGSLKAIDTRGLPLVVENVSKFPDFRYRLVRFDAPYVVEGLIDFPLGVDATGFVTEQAGTWFWAGGEFLLYAPPARPRRVAAARDYVYFAEGVLGT
jgi:hypothetical protein